MWARHFVRSAKFGIEQGCPLKDLLSLPQFRTATIPGLRDTSRDEISHATLSFQDKLGEETQLQSYEL